MADFDYEASAELYPSRRYAKTSRQQYRRFVTAAAAIQFIIEDLPPSSLAGSFLEVDDRRYEGGAIRALYDAEAYPLQRQLAAA
jgi:hypothetical protein